MATPKEVDELIALLRLFMDGPSRRIQEATQGEFAILNYLNAKEDNATPTELSKAFSLTTARIANILHSLEKKKYIIRIHDQDDRRKVFVEITDLGKQVANQKMSEVRQETTDLLNDLGEEDANEYLRIMRRIGKLVKKERMKRSNQA